MGLDRKKRVRRAGIIGKSRKDVGVGLKRYGEGTGGKESGKGGGETGPSLLEAGGGERLKNNNNEGGIIYEQGKEGDGAVKRKGERGDIRQSPRTR